MSRPYLLTEAARDRCTIRVRCTSCGRVATFVAADLAHLLPPNTEVQLVPFACKRCQRSHLHIRAYTIAPSDRGKLVLRPAGHRSVVIWREMPLD